MTKLWRRSISLNYGDMRIAAAGYVLLPVALFFIGFLRWYYALIGMAALGVSFYSIIRSRRTNIMRPRTIELRLSSIIGLFFIMLLWCQLGGLNGYGYQTGDFDCRNAIFRDLITHRWPVYYESTNSALVYYIGHWLPSALIGKLADLLFHNARFTWFAGRMALWAWTSMGLTILALLLFLYADANTLRKRFIVTMVLIFFSGLDFFGAWYHDALEKLLLDPEVIHLEWWALVDSQFSSITTCLYWVFNQSITPWIVTACFLLDENESNYLAYGIGCVICGPLSLIGLALLMVIRAICRLFISISQHRFKDWIKAIFSPGNIALLILAFPFFIFYLFGNNAIGATSESEVLVQGGFFSSAYWNRGRWIFFLFEIGFYVILLWNAHKKNPVFYAVVLSLLCIPYFHVGVGQDFCMRASIPGIFILLMYTANYLVRYLPSRQLKPQHKKPFRQVCAVLLLLVFLCGALNPCVEIYRGIYHVVTKGTYQLARDGIVSLDNLDTTTNFSTANADQQFFFKYLAKPLY